MDRLTPSFNLADGFKYIFGGTRRHAYVCMCVYIFKAYRDIIIFVNLKILLRFLSQKSAIFVKFAIVIHHLIFYYFADLIVK